MTLGSAGKPSSKTQSRPGGPLGGLGKPDVVNPPKKQTDTVKAGLLPGRVRGAVKLWSPELELSVTARHRELPQVIQERAGGWEVRERPFQIPRTQRSGNGNLLRIKLVVMLDGWGAQPRSVQPELDALRRFGYQNHGEPVTLVVIGAVPYASGGVLPSTQEKAPDWVLDRLEIVNELFTFLGEPARSVATIELLEYVPGNAETRVEKAKRAYRYVWKKGDTLSKVAKKELGSSSRTTWIRKANPYIKSWSKLEAGDMIVIPIKEPTRGHRRTVRVGGPVSGLGGGA